MITRRRFLQATAALAMTPVFEKVARHYATTGEPLFLKPPKAERRFFLHPEKKGIRLVTDAPDVPLPIVRREAFERELGPGSYRTHTQRDHWRLIEEGRFDHVDLIVPQISMGEFDVWQATYAPWSEALTCLEDEGIGPGDISLSGAGVRFYEYGSDPDVYGPAVLVDDLFSASLLQAIFVERRVPVEIRQQERS